MMMRLTRPRIVAPSKGELRDFERSWRRQKHIPRRDRPVSRRPARAFGEAALVKAEEAAARPRSEVERRNSQIASEHISKFAFFPTGRIWRSRAL
jgi:hypothetical protein